MKDIYISDLAGFDEGKPFDSYFLLLARQQRSTKTNKPYLSLTLGDKTGQLEARVWDISDPRIARDAAVGDIIKVRGTVSVFDGKMQMKIEQMRKANPNEASKSDLLPATTCDVSALWAKLSATIDSFSDPDLKRLLQAMFADEALVQAYREAPAARQLHHAWLGGLLEHVVSLIGLAEKVASHYPMVHRDLLLTGVILHDIGKTRELKWDLGFDYTIEGVLVGHIQMGVAMVEKAMDGLQNFPPRLRTMVIHLILSHHGKLEFGSPKLPMTPEALVLNFVDDLDAKMQAVTNEFERMSREGRSRGELTGKVWSLENRQMLDTHGWLQGGKQEG